MFARSTTLLLRALLAAVLLIALAACASDSDDSAFDTASTSGDESYAEFAEDTAYVLGAEADGGAQQVGGGDDAAAGGNSGSDGQAVSPLEPSGQDATPPRPGERIIKEGTINLRVPDGQFDAAFSQIVSRTQALGGYVAGSSTSTDGEGLVSGQVTVRVPVEAFEDLLTAVGDAGEVLDRDISSQDVSEEFTDLEARRRNLQAQERFYLGLLEEAQSINDAIAVQQQLEGIQTQIEQITGRLNLLENRSSLSTLTVRLNEAGAEGLDRTEPRGILGRAMDEAGDTFLSAIGFLIVVLAGVSPFVLLFGVPVGIYLLVRRSRRRSSTPTAAPTATSAPMADPLDEREPIAAGPTGSE